MVSVPIYLSRGDHVGRIPRRRGHRGLVFRRGLRRILAIGRRVLTLSRRVLAIVEGRGLVRRRLEGLVVRRAGGLPLAPLIAELVGVDGLLGDLLPCVRVDPLELQRTVLDGGDRLNRLGQFIGSPLGHGHLGHAALHLAVRPRRTQVLIGPALVVL
jgi:hypothetical protein